MKIILKEIKATENFRFDKAFIESLKKPGKKAFIRFSDEMPGGEILLTPNISQYSYGHTPAAIYGYPLDNQKVVNDLRSQNIQFNNLPIIIVYWIDEDKIVNLNTLTKEQVKDLFSQIINMKGKDVVIGALKKWLERLREDERSSTWAVSSFRSIPAKLLENGLNIDGLLLTPEEPGQLFWNTIRYIGTGKEKTSILLRLRLKQEDSEGNIIEKRFNTILDEKAVMDTTDPVSGKSQAPVQALTLTSAGIGKENYKFYNNPSATVKRRYNKHGQKRPDPKILTQKNFEMFEKYRDAYFAQLGGLKSKINDNIKMDRTSGGYKFTLRLPTPSGGSNIEKSIVKRITKEKQKKDSSITENEISKIIAERVVADWLKLLDGPRYEPGRMKFESDLRDEKLMLTKPDGDYFEFTIDIVSLSSDILSPIRVYSLFYYLFDVLTKKNEDNPFIDWKKYLELSKIRTQYL